MPFERPRVRAEGPGGPDIKQGARIACLDCRSAKIRCSAPTDGKVPCKRCARHGRECLFEKHRRGRKPGRTNNARPDMNGLHSMGGSNGSSGSGSDRSLSMGLAHSGAEREQYHNSGEVYFAASTHHTGSGHNISASPKLGSSQFPPFMPPNPHHSTSSSTYAHHSSTSSTSSNSAGGWRQPLSSDDPRLISPRHAAVRSLPSQHLPPSSPSSSSMAPLAKTNAPSTSPQLRDTRHAHPSYLPYSTGLSMATSNGLGSHSNNKISPASPFQSLPYSTKHFDTSQTDGHFGSSGSVRYSGGHAHTQFADGGSRGKQDDEHTRGSSSSNVSFGNLSRFSEPSSFSPPSSGLPPSSLGSGTTPGRSWLDFPTPGTRSLLSPSHLMATSIGTFPTSSGGLPTAWPGSAITSPHNKRRGGPTDYFAGALPLVSPAAQEPIRYNSSSRHEVVKNGTVPSSPGSETRKRQRVEDELQLDESRSESRVSADDSSRFAETKSTADEEEDEEEIDHMDEDEVGGAHDGDVLSTPLRLLAHASDAALAIRQAKGDTDGGSSSQRSTSHGAATMGLVSHPVPSLPAPSKWFDSGRLPNMSQSDARAGNTRGGLLPRLTSVAQRRDLQRSAALASTYDSGKRDVLPTNFAARAASALPPPSLTAIGRSRSYTAVETASLTRASYLRISEEAVRDRSPPIVAAPVTHSERRAEVLGIRTDAEGRQIEVNNALGSAMATNGGNSSSNTVEHSITPSTLDPDAWEYRDGRVRSRKSISAGPGTSNGTGSTTTEEESSGSAARRQSDGVIGLSKPGAGADDDASAAVQGDSSIEVKAGFRARLGSMDAKPRWEIVRRRASKPSLGLAAGSVSASSAIASALDETQSNDGSSSSSSDESEKLGASHQDFFSMSIFHSKMDNDVDLDPVRVGLIQLRELERLFDIFFARVNPLLTIFDPFLHSVTYVRNRSALLTTVIAALAARLSDSGRHAKLAVVLENHWRQKLLPEALLGGYKSVELAQAFLVLAIYHKPTNRLSEDRSWQYLGFAIRIATEIGVNRLTQPSDEVKDNEQVRRRMRNRTRLWISLWLTDRSLSLQTGRLHTISEDDLIQRSDLWHREDFALPEDARLVSSVKLMRIVTNACIVLADVVGQHSAALVQDQLILPSEAAILQSQESIKSLTFRRIQAISELDRWKDIWCAEVLDESSDGIQSLAIGTSLSKWRPRALIDLLYARLHLNSIVLEAMERHQRLVLAASKSVAATSSSEPAFKAQFDETEQMSNKVALDCWDTSLRMIDMLLNDVPEEDLAAGPNALAINVIYGAMAALRLSNAYRNTAHGAEWASREAIVTRCKALAEALIKAGRTPEHRNGAAAPFGAYLKSIVTLWETDIVGLPSAQRGKCGSAELSTSVTAAQESRPGRQSLERDSSGAQSATSKMPLASITPGQHAGFGSTSISAVPTSNESVQQQQSMVMEQYSTNVPGSAKADQAQPGTPSLLLQHHSVGDEIWGASFAPSSRHNRSASSQQTEAESMDRMWDYLTTYPDASTTFPMSLWQPQINNTTPNLGFGAVLPAMGTGNASLDGPIEAGTASTATVNAVAAVAAANIAALSMTNIAHPSTA